MTLMVHSELINGKMFQMEFSDPVDTFSCFSNTRTREVCINHAVETFSSSPIGSIFILLMESSPVVIDIGSAWCKAGLSGKNYPTLIIPTVVGYQPYDENLNKSPPKMRKVIGSENMHVLRELSVTEFPVNRGQILNWEAMEAIWHHTFDCLHIKTKDHPVLITELPWKDRNYQQKILEIMMETFNVPSLHFGNQAELAMYGSGLLTGIVLECGAGLTHIVPILGGHMIPKCLLVHETGGLDISVLLYKHLFQEDMRLNDLVQREAMDDLKEKFCYVNKIPYQKESSGDLTSKQGRVSVLPDGMVISLTEQHCTFPDIFFNPSQFGVLGPKLGLEVLKSAMSCPHESKDNIFSHVVLSGGSTLFPGFPERLLWELNTTKPLMYSTEVVSRPNRIYLPWIGGAILSRLSTFGSCFITKMEYYEARAAAGI
ncbi:uncharacterized protein LOC141508325 [Macrotis lagotis]|uniref:uncharacterized protein LOC141508325 n=1 Tax=Macrotis lagotis TaxID=92651 RepID=UPI003D692A0E